jgi:hypothetical protein
VYLSYSSLFVTVDYGLSVGKEGADGRGAARHLCPLVIHAPEAIPVRIAFAPAVVSCFPVPVLKGSKAQ